MNEIIDEIVQQVNENVDLPLLTEDQEEILFEIIAKVLIARIPSLI